VIYQAGRFAERLRRAAPGDTGAQVDLAFRLALGRRPDPDERRASVALAASALPELCHVLFNLNEFVYRQ